MFKVVLNAALSLQEFAVFDCVPSLLIRSRVLEIIACLYSTLNYLVISLTELPVDESRASSCRWHSCCESFYYFCSFYCVYFFDPAKDFTREIRKIFLSGSVRRFKGDE